jgi:Ni,Fe-hydrogenase I small subunit
MDAWIGASAVSWKPFVPYGAVENDLEGRAKVIWLLVGPNSGFNRCLINSKSRQLTSVIEGPYGLPVDFIEYDRILMVATGIGIAAQMSYLKELVAMKDEKKSKRTLYVVWEVDKECEYNSYCLSDVAKSDSKRGLGKPVDESVVAHGQRNMRELIYAY